MSLKKLTTHTNQTIAHPPPPPPRHSPSRKNQQNQSKKDTNITRTY